MNTSGRESRDAAAEAGSGIHIPRLDRPGVRPHAYQIGPITAADNRSKRHRPLNSWPARATFIYPKKEKLHLTKGSEKKKSTRPQRFPGGTGGKGCARRNSASASSSSALAPDERTTRLSITRPCRSRLKKTWATPCSPRRAEVSG